MSVSAWPTVGAAEDLQETSLSNGRQSMEPAFDVSLNLKCWQIIPARKKEKQGDPSVFLQRMIFNLEQW